MYDRPYEDVIIKTIKPVIVEPEVPEVADTTMVADTTKTE